MFNAVAQSVVGFGWPELVFRGFFLGLVLAKIRALYIRRSTSFWATLFYFYILIISYSLIRSTAIYGLFSLTLFRFLLFYVGISVAVRVLRAKQGGLRVAAHGVSTN